MERHPPRLHWRRRREEGSCGGQLRLDEAAVAAKRDEVEVRLTAALGLARELLLMTRTALVAAGGSGRRMASRCGRSGGWCGAGTRWGWRWPGRMGARRRVRQPDATSRRSIPGATSRHSIPNGTAMQEQRSVPDGAASRRAASRRRCGRQDRRGRRRDRWWEGIPPRK